MSKKKAVKKTVKAAPRVVEGANASVLINVFSPGHEPTEFRVTIPNIVGSANLLHRSPFTITSTIIAGLRAKYGDRVE